MDCPRCGAHNETDVGSCLSCGAPMSEDESLPTIAARPVTAPAAKASSPRLAQGAPPKQCPSCMTLNAATFKFCARCGTPLGATVAPGAPQVAKPAASKPAVGPAAKTTPPPPVGARPAAPTPVRSPTAFTVPSTPQQRAPLPVSGP